MQRFPFPGEGSPAAPGAGSPRAPVPDAPGVGGAGKGDARDEFPFPGEPGKPGAAGGSGENSSSSSSSSSDDAPAADVMPGDSPDGSGPKGKGSDAGAAPQGRHLLHRVNPIGTKLQTDDEREAEDLDIAHYYTQTGNLKGAYLRSQDAVKTAPDDPNAHFALAEIALKLNKRDEAIAEYDACLKHDPADKEAKAARKELARLKP